MNFQINSESDKHAKLKMGLIPVLILGFGYVVFMPESKPTPPAPPVATTTVSIPNAAQDVEQLEVDGKKVIPEISLAEMTAHDPFQLLPILRPKVVPTSKKVASNTNSDSSTLSTVSKLEMDKEQELLAEVERMAELKKAIQSLVIQGIFASGSKRSVLINSMIFKEGDDLVDGVKIHRINSKDIVLDIGSSKRIVLK